LRLRGAMTERIAHMNACACIVEMRRGGIDRDVDQLLDLRRQRAGAPWHGRQIQIGFEEVGIEGQDVVPDRTPVPPRCNELLFELQLSPRELAHATPSSN